MKKLLLFLFLLPTIVFGRKFYFSSSTGNDSYTSAQAQNQATPWQTLQKLQRSVTSGAAIFLPGDTICFKRGDVFANGYTRFSTPNYYTYASCSWSNDPAQGWTAPSGTPTNPIVFTSYGDVNLPRPNFYYPLAETPITNNSYNVFYFSGVHDIIIDGLQFDDTRFPVQDKSNPSYTRTAIIFGEWTQSKVVNGVVVYGSNRDPNMRKYMVTDCIIKNCYFSNVSFAICNAGINCKFQNNTITNLKSTVDTTGFTDIGAGAFEALYGFYNEFSNNYIKGAWCRTGRVSDGNGMMGVAFDIFCLKNCKFINNTIIDCSGTWEIGNTDRYDTLSGAWYDTFAYNKIVNCGQFGYIHGSPGDVFSGNNRNIGCFNNVVINNNTSRISGPNFGWDLYNDGQSFRGNLAGQFAWWFFRSPTKCPTNFFQTGSVTNGSTIVTIPTTGIQIGSRLYDVDETGGYKEVTAIGSGQVTVAAPFTVSNSSYSFNIYPPLADQSWSYPINPPYCNWGGHRYVVQYASDNIKGNADTLVDLRNNIFYATTGDQFIYDASRTKQKHINNIYYIKGAFLNPTSLGGTLGTGEYSTTTKLFVDTSNVLVDNWDLKLASGSLGISAGIAVPGLTKDFAGNNLTNPPSIGLYNYSSGTAAASAPTVTTAAAIVGSATSATLGGNVTADGGATVYRRGVVYSTGAVTDTTNVGGGGKLIVTSTGLGAYSIPTATLVRGTVYYARAFALNSAGVSYGAEVSFTTLNIPTIATVGATAITQTTAVSGGNVSVDGNSAIIKRGLIYSTSAITDTSNGTKIVATTASTGSFSTNLSGLSPNTLYHIRAYAYNAIGIAYGSDLTFTTATQIISPITVSSTNTTIACNGDSSTVVISASGGVAPYTGTGTFTKEAGTHTFTVTDGYANSGSKVITISQPTLITSTLTFPPVTTVGGTTTVTVSSTGGTGTKLYAMDGGAYQSGTSFTGITAGAHTLSVTDGNACIVSKAFTVNTTTQATKSALKFKN